MKINFEIPVKANHIRKGGYSDENCPIALALRQKFKRASIRVNTDQLEFRSEYIRSLGPLGNALWKRRVILPLNKDITNMIHQYDTVGKKTMEPFTLQFFNLSKHAVECLTYWEKNYKDEWADV